MKLELITVIDNQTTCIYYGKVLTRDERGTKLAPYTKDGVRIAKRSFYFTEETHTILEAS